MSRLVTVGEAQSLSISGYGQECPNLIKCIVYNRTARHYGQLLPGVRDARLNDIGGSPER